MEHDEHEILVEYSEMTSFNFSSKEYQKVKRDYIDCKNFLSKFEWYVSNLLRFFRLAKNY